MDFKPINNTILSVAINEVDTLYINKQITLYEKQAMGDFFYKLFKDNLSSAENLYKQSNKYVTMHLQRIWREIEV
jgi:hypothetical protein